MSISERDILKFAESICKSSAFSMMIVDDQLTCVYSRCPKLVPVGTVLSLLIKEPIETPLKKEVDAILIKDGDSYCARFIPLDQKYSFCQLLDISDIMTLASYTELYSSVEQRLLMFAECYNNIRKYVDQINEELPPRTKMKLMRTMDVYAEVNRMKTLTNELSDFVYTAISPKNDTLIDVREMVSLMISRINTILSDYDKGIEFIDDVGGYYIHTNKRYAIIAVMSALQNALLYSPIKNEPIATLTKTEKDGKSFILLQILNNIENYTKADENNDPDFSYRRCGLGFPVIKKFVQRAGGEFYFKTSSSKARVGILIPEYELKSSKEIFKSDPSDFYFGDRDIIEDMMMDVIALISKKKKRR